MLPWAPSSLPYLIEIFNASGAAALHYTVVELEKNVTDRQRTEREQTEKPITEAILISMDHQVEQTNYYITIFSIMFIINIINRLQVNKDIYLYSIYNFI